MDIEKYDIITLSNDKRYAVTEMLDFDDLTYGMLVEVDESNNPKEQADIRIVELFFDGEDNRAIEITDPVEQQQVKEVFENHFKNNNPEE